MAFVLDGRIAVRWFGVIPVNPLAPTQTECTTATNFVATKQTEELIEINGFEKTASSIALPGYAGRAVGSLAGEISFAASSLVWRMHETTRMVYNLIQDDIVGWLGFAQDGLGAGKEMEIFPASVATKNRRKGRNAANAFEAFFSIDAPYKATQAA